MYRCGIREDELLALTPDDFEFEKQTVLTTNPISVSRGRILSPIRKAPKSNRVVKMPDFLSQEIQDFIGQLYGKAGITLVLRRVRETTNLWHKDFEACLLFVDLYAEQGLVERIVGLLV